jgi:hypothetical protein
VGNEKQFDEAIAQFFEKPTREGLRELLRSNRGETDLLDFKEKWPSDAKSARHILALANSGGGVIVAGVRQEEDGSLTSVGLTKMRDKAEISKGLKGYFPPTLEYLVLDFAYKSSEYPDLVGKSFQVLIVESDPKALPYLAGRDGTGVRANAVYVRRKTESVEADHGELERLLNKRIETGYSSSRVLELEEHIAQLKTLYSSIDRTKTGYHFPGLTIQGILKESAFFSSKPNPHYPKETLDEYISQLIERKKRRIEEVLELGDYSASP